MINPFLILLLIAIPEEIPFKPKDDFEVKFELTFKQRIHDEKTVYMDETRAQQEKRKTSTPLPYLKLFFKIKRVEPGEIKMKVVRDDKTTLFTKKATQDMEFKLDLGFTDDIKDGIIGYKHVIQFLSVKKDVLSLIVIEFDKDGNYFVNGEKRGRI
jgi:hypothetical protein